MSKRKKYNKSIAGYHMLMILSAVDFKFNVHEDIVIRDWLVQEFPFAVDLDQQMEVVSALHPNAWEEHFKLCKQDYEDEATENERHDLLIFAYNLINADKFVYEAENIYVEMLQQSWFPEEELGKN